MTFTGIKGRLKFEDNTLQVVAEKVSFLSSEKHDEIKKDENLER